MPAFFSSVFGTILDGVNPYLKTYTFGDALAGCVIQTERARKAASGPGQPVRLRGKLFDTAWDLYALSIAIGIIGGWAIAYLTGIMIPADYIDGLLMDFKPYSIVYSLIKTAVFAYIITSISAFYGYYAKGNSLEVGAASTRAVVASSVVIMIFNLILTQVLLI